MTRARVDVVIVSWNTHDLLHRCLRALEASRGDYGRIVYVVDNGSTDGSQQLVRSEFPQVHLLENSTNLGFAAANNQAIHEGDAEWVLLLNSDAFLEPETLAGMLAEMGRYPRCAALGCRLVYADGSLQRSAYAFPSLATEIFQITFLDRLFPKSRLFGRYLMTWWDSKDSREVDVVMGAVMLLRRSALDEIGLLDESFFMYSEEVDLCYRLKKAGWVTRYCASVQATHLWGGSAQKVPAATLLRLYQSKIKFFRKHYGALSTGLYKAVLGFSSVLRGGLGMLFGWCSGRREIRDKGASYWLLARSLGQF